MSLQNTSVILLGHGTTLNPESAVPVVRHATALQARRLFAEVLPAFWKQPPYIREVLSQAGGPEVFIVPMFISEGYFSDEVIPRELGFDLAETSRVQRLEGKTLRYTPPVGTHESMTRVLLARASDVTAKFPFPRAPRPRETTLFIAGHGTKRNENSRSAIEQQADLIRAQDIYGAVHAIFMEEEPYIKDYASLAQTKYAIVVPFFMSDGLHVQEDIPVLMGEPEKLVKSRVAAGQPSWRNPTEKRGKLTWYTSSVGTDPAIVDVIIERVREAAGQG